MKRSARVLAAAAPLLLSALAHAGDQPNFDARYAAPPRAALPADRAAPAPPAGVASRDERRGAPTFLWAARNVKRGFGRIPGVTAEAAARLHLAEHATRYGLSAEAIDTTFVQQIHDTGRGGIIVVLRQAPGGVPVFHNDIKVLLDRDLELVAIGGNLHAAAVKRPKAPAFTVPERAAIAAALTDLYAVPVGAADLVDTKDTKGGYRHYDLSPSSTPAAKGLGFVVPARAKKVYFPLPDRLVPAYFVELVSGDRKSTTADAYAYVIAADDGRLLYRENLTHTDTFNYRVYADPTGDKRPTDGPLVDHCPHPAGAPDGSAPGYTTSNLISIDGFNKFKDPWLAPGATQTKGNNVDAYTDDGAPDGFSSKDVRATVTGPGTFDRSYDPTLDPQASNEQKMASVTSIFYVTNWLHDWWYDSGFDEAAGNAQTQNFGRGGLAGDPLRAEAQDGAPAQRNNANMSTLADGGSPRMQMFVWDGASSAVLGVSPLNQNLVTGLAAFGPQTFDVSGAVALVSDGSAPVTDACQPISSDVAGKIALVDRGTCTFKQKVVAAESAGAIGVILANNAPSEPPPPMGNGSPNTPVNIPVLSVTLADGNALKAALQSGPVTASMSRSVAADRDGTIDNTVVAHEWGHYIHLRQVDCGAPTCGAESEGWGDFFALHMTVREGDDLHGVYPLSQYATGAFPDDPAYFGIRRYPYSVDFTRNALTFKHISDGEPLPEGVPVAESTAQVYNSEVHAAGEIWASMLFEAFVALLERSQGPSPAYSFEEARRRMGDYVEAGLKLAPSDPTFTEQRDAVLAAAAAADLADLEVMAKAFARRGAGTCAVSPPRDSQDFIGVVESFDVQPNLTILSVKVDDSVTTCDGDGRLDAEETGKVVITVMNTGTAEVESVEATVKSATAGVLFPSGAKASFGAIAALSTATATVEVSLAATSTKVMNADLEVTLDGVVSCDGAAKLHTAPVVNYDEVAAAAAADTMEAESSAWTPTGADASHVWARTEPKVGNHVWAGIDYPSPTDTALVSPTLVVSPTESFVLTFDHRHSFEESGGINWDGSVVEISIDGSNKWQDISTYGDPGYGGTIGDPAGQAKNALIDKEGYVGTNAGWPAMDTVTIDMGTALAGKSVKIRFRIGTDDAAGDTGWEIDNVSLAGIENQPFSALLDDKGTCGAPPVADAGPDQAVKGGDQVTLDGSGSVDPGGAPLGFTWREKGGKSVTLSSATTSKATFVAPAVASPTTLTFELKVERGAASSTDTVDVLVLPGDPGDAGADAGSAAEAPSAEGGCACEAGGSSTSTSSGMGALLLSLLGLAARRRRRAR